MIIIDNTIKPIELNITFHSFTDTHVIKSSLQCINLSLVNKVTVNILKINEKYKYVYNLYDVLKPIVNQIKTMSFIYHSNIYDNYDDLREAASIYDFNLDKFTALESISYAIYNNGIVTEHTVSPQELTQFPMNYMDRIRNDKTVQLICKRIEEEEAAIQQSNPYNFYMPVIRTKSQRRNKLYLNISDYT